MQFSRLNCYWPHLHACKLQMHYQWGVYWIWSIYITVLVHYATPLGIFHILITFLDDILWQCCMELKCPELEVFWHIFVFFSFSENVCALIWWFIDNMTFLLNEVELKSTNYWTLFTISILVIPHYILSSNYLWPGGKASPLNFGGQPIDRSLFMDTQLNSDLSWWMGLKDHRYIKYIFRSHLKLWHVCCRATCR